MTDSKMPELLPCPFCGGKAEIINIDDGENAGGSAVGCGSCLASSNVDFGHKENFISNWNRRAHPAAMTAERDALVAALTPFAFFDDVGGSAQSAWEIRYKDRFEDWVDFADIEGARAALAAAEKETHHG